MERFLITVKDLLHVYTYFSFASTILHQLCIVHYLVLGKKIIPYRSFIFPFIIKKNWKVLRTCNKKFYLLYFIFYYITVVAPNKTYTTYSYTLQHENDFILKERILPVAVPIAATDRLTTAPIRTMLLNKILNCSTLSLDLT